VVDRVFQERVQHGEHGDEEEAFQVTGPKPHQPPMAV
jgi:hypothetical protein